jgi:ribosomal protein S12 methylthiotransferase accessory factor
MEMTITLGRNQRVDANFKGFRIVTDQPLENGGDESAPTPYDLFLASLGTCMGYYAGRFCAARGLSTEGIDLALAFEREAEGKGVRAVRVAIHLPEGFPEKYRRALLAAVESCAVKRQLEHPPRFAFELTEEPAVLTSH